MRDLPRAVVSSAVGTEVLLKVLRDGETLNITVTLGQLPGEDEDLLSPESSDGKEQLLGLTIEPLTADLRAKFAISGKGDGVVITSVEPGSPAAKKRIKVGDVILEVRQKRVRKPEEVVAWLSAIRKSGRDKILFLLANADGDLRLVNVPIS